MGLHLKVRLMSPNVIHSWKLQLATKARAYYKPFQPSLMSATKAGAYLNEAFVSGKPFQPSLMFVGKAKSPTYSGAPERCFTQVGSGLTCKH